MIYQNIYRKINIEKYKQVFILSDLHGKYDLLNEQLEKVNFNKETDLLISVGDLIDRGEKSLECLSLINEKWFDCVIGNHEYMCMLALDHYTLSNARFWGDNGGGWGIRLIRENNEKTRKLLRLIEKLKEEKSLILEINNGIEKLVVAHADYPLNTYRYNQTINEDEVLWSRERLYSLEEIEIEGADLFVFGHTIVEKPVKLGNRCYIDVGSYDTNKITLLKIK